MKRLRPEDEAKVAAELRTKAREQLSNITTKLYRFAGSMTPEEFLSAVTELVTAYRDCRKEV